MAEPRKGFDLAAVLGSVSDLDTGSRPAPGREQIEYIDIDRIDSDERNFYHLSDIDDLADNIRLCGLQQPIRVRTKEDGRYTIVSGHRRQAALRQLVDEGLAQFRQVPCIQETDDASPALQELRLIFANSSTRKLTSAEIGEQAERVEALLYQLKEEGYEFPEGRMRDVVAAACNTHGSKLGRIKVIQSRLVSEFKGLWKSGKLPEQSAYTLAKFPPAMQSRIAEAFPQVPSGSSLECLLTLYKDRGYRWEPSMTCPDGKPCKRGDAFLRHDADCFSLEACGGKTCCLECSRSQEQYYACDRACSKAKAVRKETMDSKKAAEKAAADKRLRKAEREMSASAARLVRAADAADIPDKTVAVSDRYGWSFTVKQLREIAAGNFNGQQAWSNRLEPENIKDIARVARALHCSADYIVGLTDELRPGAQNTPPAAGSCQSPPTGITWYSSDVEPGVGSEIIVIDAMGLADSAVYLGGGTLLDDSAMEWDEVTLWTLMPTDTSAPLSSGPPPVGGRVSLRFVDGREVPPEDGQYYCRFACDGDPFLQLAWWDSDSRQWCFRQGGMPLDTPCLGWFPLPPEDAPCC